MSQIDINEETPTLEMSVVSEAGKKLEVTLGGTVYPLSTKLRVAYALQGEFNHKAYLQIFAGLQTDTLENQAKIIYVSAKLGSESFKLSFKDFLDYLLDEINLTQLTDLCADIIEGITFNGMSEDEIMKKKAEAQRKQLGLNLTGINEL